MATPTIPLLPDVRASYEDVYAKNQAAIDSTDDFDLLKSLNASQLQIGGLLSVDDQYRIQADSALFQSMLGQIDATNTGLKALQGQIKGIASNLDVFSDVVGAIDKLLSMV